MKIKWPKYFHCNQRPSQGPGLSPKIFDNLTGWLLVSTVGCGSISCNQGGIIGIFHGITYAVYNCYLTIKPSEATLGPQVELDFFFFLRVMFKSYGRELCWSVKLIRHKTHEEPLEAVKGSVHFRVFEITCLNGSYNHVYEADLPVLVWEVTRAKLCRWHCVSRMANEISQHLGF